MFVIVEFFECARQAAKVEQERQQRLEKEARQAAKVEQERQQRLEKEARAALSPEAFFEWQTAERRHREEIAAMHTADWNKRRRW